ncbi:MAG: EamA family transporter [Proteobacteria bacterium]|nr:EamA family transporter [Pseudomonadota bacterium]
MEPLVVAMVLAAAVMHAVWNTVLKVGSDRLMTMAVVIGLGGTLSPGLILYGPPPLPESWIFIALSVALHCAYFFFLVQAYRVGDLSYAYPLARGSAPLIVAAGAALFAGELLSPLELVAVAVISGGIFSLLLTGGYGMRGEWRAVAYPIATGVMIAAYTVTDGLGVRLSGNPASYIGWLFLFSAIPIVVLAAVKRRAEALVFLRRYWKRSIMAGTLAFCAYSLVIWALSLAAMAHVSALRETSVVIAALIGTRLLGEPFGARRVLSAATVAGGVVLLQLAA